MGLRGNYLPKIIYVLLKNLTLLIANDNKDYQLFPRNGESVKNSRNFLESLTLFPCRTKVARLANNTGQEKMGGSQG